MAKTGEEGAKRLQEDCVFFNALDEVMGTRDVNNPELMNIRDTAILPKRKGKELVINPRPESAVSDDEAEDEVSLNGDGHSNYSSGSELDEEENVEKRLQQLEEKHLEEIKLLEEEIKKKGSEKESVIKELEEEREIRNKVQERFHELVREFQNFIDTTGPFEKGQSDFMLANFIQDIPAGPE